MFILYYKEIADITLRNLTLSGTLKANKLANWADNIIFLDGNTDFA